MSIAKRRYLPPERMMDEASYLSGYADGEGCFCVTFNQSRRHKFGWDIRPSFSVSQNRDRAEVLRLFQKRFGCGTIRPDRSDKTLKYEVRGVAELTSKVIPHFEKYPLLSSKRKDFENFAAIVKVMNEGGHLDKEGFEKIIQLADGLNVGSKKKYVRRQIKV
jgi:hypothetical protein